MSTIRRKASRRKPKHRRYSGGAVPGSDSPALAPPPGKGPPPPKNALLQEIQNGMKLRKVDMTDVKAAKEETTTNTTKPVEKAKFKKGQVAEQITERLQEGLKKVLKDHICIPVLDEESKKLSNLNITYFETLKKIYDDLFSSIPYYSYTLRDIDELNELIKEFHENDLIISDGSNNIKINEKKKAEYLSDSTN